MAKLLQNIPMLEAFPVDNIGNLDRRWKIYREELELFLTASGITNDNQKRAVLLHVSGKQVRDIFNTFSNVGPSYQDACDRLDEYFLPKKNVIYERWQFHNSKQGTDENTLTYVTRLKTLSETCEYQNSDEEVRDQFVFSCHDNKLREKLLQTKNLTLEKLLEVGKIYERAKQQANEIGGVENINIVHRQSQNQKSSNQRKCYRCGDRFNSGHLKTCPALGKPCRQCGIIGHFKSVCRGQKVQRVDGETSEDEVENLVNTLNIKQDSSIYENVFSSQPSHKKSGPPLFNVVLNKVKVKMVGDTGASCSCINRTSFNRIQKYKPLYLKKTKTLIKTFGNKQTIKPIGKITLLLERKEKFFAETIYVMPNDSFENILSKDACLSLGFIEIHDDEIKPEKQVFIMNTGKPERKLKDLLIKYKEVFNGDGLLKNYEHKLHIDDSIPPVAQRLRRYPLSVRDTINSEIDKLMQKDFIEPVNQPAGTKRLLPTTYYLLPINNNNLQN